MDEPLELRAIVDNWLLENVSHLIAQGLPYPPTIEEFSDYHPDVGNYRHYHLYPLGCDSTSDFRTYADVANYWQRQVCDYVTSLLHLLDVIVLYDKIEYDKFWSRGWVHAPALEPLNSVLHPIHVATDSESEEDEDDPFIAARADEGQPLELLGRSWEYENYLTPIELTYFNEEKPEPDVVRDGAIYYFNLARAVGAHYWPAPPRVEFLASEMDRYAAAKTISKLQVVINNSLEQIVRQALVPLEPASQTYTFPGFGCTVLADCKDKSEIFHKAIAYRNSDTAKAFRNWLAQLERALSAGDVMLINKGLHELRDILEDFKIGKASIDDILGGTELTIGLSPSLKLKSDLIKPLLRRFKQKPHHVVFLRTHLERVLKNANVWHQVRRLFPETFDA